MNREPFVACLQELAAASAEVILPYFGRLDLGVELKSDASPVTLADRGAEKVMREMIERRFPTHGIIGEEYGNVREDAGSACLPVKLNGNFSRRFSLCGQAF